MNFYFCTLKVKHVQLLVLRLLGKVTREEVEERLHLNVKCLQ